MTQIWKKNNITLYLDDCFAILPTLESHSIDMILADLPYGVTACSWDSVLSLDLLWKEYKRIIKRNGAIVLTATQPFAWKLCASNSDWFRYEIIWEKPNGTNPLLVAKQPFRCHENILVFYQYQPTYHPQMMYGKSTYKEFNDSSKSIGEAYAGTANTLISKHKSNTTGARFPRSVQKFEQDRSGHPTKKPVALMSWLIRTYTEKNERVLDNTMGEGTTAVACVQEQRQCIGIELDSLYFETACRSVEQEMLQQEKKQLISTLW